MFKLSVKFSMIGSRWKQRLDPEHNLKTIAQVLPQPPQIFPTLYQFSCINAIFS